MTEQQTFVDYYRILQVKPACDAKTLEAAYRRLAKAYHPDHFETADVDKFNEVVQAYKILRNAEDRLQYDIQHNEHVPAEEVHAASFDDVTTEEKAALTDAEAHEKILLTLYKKRRENAQNPGVLAFYIKEALHCSEELFEFHAWYLKAKGFIERTEQNELAITVEGIDHVISMSRSHMAAQLRIARLEDEPVRPKRTRRKA
ncbi:DnaJ domain-containing protein [Sphingorhabdus sp.]|uniref:DnaJ domain-containing protein n=1 Tax=Sphingorhabdus sp. TaxID=1902408 RepID=UPI00398371F6